MNLAVRRRLADLRTVLLGGKFTVKKSGRCRKIGMRSGKCQDCMVCCLKMQNSAPKHEKSPAKCKACGADNQI